MRIEYDSFVYEAKGATVKFCGRHGRETPHEVMNGFCVCCLCFIESFRPEFQRRRS